MNFVKSTTKSPLKTSFVNVKLSLINEKKINFFFFSNFIYECYVRLYFLYFLYIGINNQMNDDTFFFY